MFEKLFKYPFEEFASGALRLARGWRPELALLAVIVAVVAAVYFYRRAPANLPRSRRTLLSVLRGLALGLLVLILFQPVLRTPLPVTRDCFVAVLVDDSRSMRIEDVAGPEAPGDDGSGKGARASRLDEAKRLLGSPGSQSADPPGGLLEELTDVCPIRLFRFSGRAERVQTVAEITGTGERTNLYAALRTVNAELGGLPIVAVVMLTDGADNVGPPSAAPEIAADMGLKNIPVYCVGLGDPSPPRDYEVLRVQAPRRVRRNTAVEIFANVRAAGYDQPFNVILRRGEEVLGSAAVAPESGAGGASAYRVPLTFRPEEKGTFRYTVEIPPAEGEVIVDNNRYEFLAEVTDDRLPVLYLEGSPREEYRFVRRALFRDKDFRIVGVLRTAGPKKYVLQGAEPEDHLKPFLLRAGRPEDPTRNGFPQSLADLYRFKAVILGDIEAGYLSQKQLGMVEAFVRDGGGGLLMLGGVNSFNLGKYQGTVIEKMLPVVLPAPDVAYQQREFRISLTRAGQRHPILRQTENLLVNRNIWSKAPTLIGHNRIRKNKPGAEVLAVEGGSGGGDPVLVVQNYGAGRVAAFTTGGSWHWQMAMPVEDELHEKFWKQLVRWIAVYAKGRITVELDKDLLARKEPVAIRTTVLDEALKPVNDAKVVAIIRDPVNRKREFTQEWILSEEGVYQTQYEPIDVGDYEVQVVAEVKSASSGETLTLTETANFSVGETLTEFADAGQKTSLLKDIAGRSGGAYLSSADASQITDDVRKLVRKMKREETVYETRDVWDTPLLFALLAVALSVEWFLRRRSGLM